MTAALTNRPVKQVLVGPFTEGRGEDESFVETRHAELLALAAAGCPYIEIHEPAATTIGGDPVARARFRLWNRRLLDGVSGPHVSLAITGGNADAAGIDALLAAPYASLAVDLVAAPENWRLVVATPGDRGVICGALATERDADDRPEILLWAAGYAASTGGRGSSRVGLASASSMTHLPWDAAVRKLRVLGEAARLADMPPSERRLELDPRSVDIRSAALGRVVPRERSARRRRH